MSSPFIDNDDQRWKSFGYHARSAFVVLLSLGVLIGGGWFAYSKVHNLYLSYKAADDYLGDGVKDVIVTIPSGYSGGQIGNLLVEQGVVKSRKAFLKAYNANDKATSIQAGTYKLRTQIPASTAVTMLLDPTRVVRNQVTVPEGLWLQDQLAILSKKTGIPVAQFTAACSNPQKLGFPSYVKSCEGFLFPSTYEIGQHPTAVSILTQMAKQYNQVAAKDDLVNKAKAINHTPLEIMTIASILQAEAHAKDMPMVSGIIENRLDNATNGLASTDNPTQLQLDSTAHFLLKIPMNKPLPSGFQNLQPDSSYNTYRHEGLPEGPIDAPGETAIKAALNPTKSDYQFWVTVNLKTQLTKFAKTYDEQKKNAAEFEAWCKANGNPGGC